MRNNKGNKRLNSKDFRSIVDILLEDAFKVKVNYIKRHPEGILSEQNRRDNQ